MAASVITGLFLFFCLLQSASAEIQIEAKPGETVTLPCEAPNNAIIATVLWDRSNLDPDKYVYPKSDGHLMTDDQDPSYVNRVQLKDDKMKNGELSLILKNVNNNDEGTYNCSYKGKRRADQRKLISIVYLKVTGPTDGDSESGKQTDGGHLGVILSVTLIAALVVAGGVVGFVIYKKRKWNYSLVRNDDQDDVHTN